MGIALSLTYIFCNNEDQTSEHILNCTGLVNIREMIKATHTDEEEVFSNVYWNIMNYI